MELVVIVVVVFLMTVCYITSKVSCCNSCETCPLHLSAETLVDPADQPRLTV